MSPIFRCFVFGCVVLGACSPSPDVTGSENDTPSATQELTPEVVEELEALGYSQAADVPVRPDTISTYDPELAHPGYNVYVSGHAPEAYLIDMEGQLLHTWRKPFEEIWPDESLPNFAEQHMKLFFRQFYLFPNGDLIVNFELFGVAKLDKESNVLWSHKGFAHHDIDVDTEGNVYVLGKRVEYEDGDESQWTLYPTIDVLTPDGNLKRRLDIYEYFANSKYRALIQEIDEHGEIGDIFHNNTIRVLDGSQAHRSPYFNKGNILVTSPEFDAVYIVDPEQETITWMIRSLFHRAHDSTLLENGNILIFDNQSLGERSQIIEFEPFSHTIEWRYDGGEHAPFYSGCCSVVQRFPNGNTLAVVTAQATAFEVTPDGEIVWQFHNPAALTHDVRAGNLFELRRFPKDHVNSWLTNE